MDIVEKLRGYKKDRSGYAVYCHKAAEEIQRLRAELEALKAAQSWQPIETAPKDGTPMLLLIMRAAYVGQYEDGKWWDRDGAAFNTPTHWMPLPPTDSASAESSEGASQ